MSVATLIPDWFVSGTVFVFGMVFGSFLNVIAYRVPKGESIVLPGSQCPMCHTSLTSFELIPIVSWIVLRGRCRTCKALISMQYPLVELMTSALWVLTLWVTTDWPARFAWFAFWLLLVAVIGTDLNARRVPDILSKPGAAMTLILSVVCGVQHWWSALLGMTVCYAILMLIYVLSRGNMGRGDAKLYLSVGAMLGPWMGLETLMFASFVGTLVGVLMRLVGLLNKREYMPFVPYIAIGVVVVIFYGQTFNDWYVHTLLQL